MIAAALLLLAAAPADDLDCDNAMAQQALNMCALQEFERADAAMNAEWRRVTEFMKAADREIDRSYDKQPGHFETLLAAQRAWITFRDKHCEVASFEMRGGSAQPMVDSGCRTQLTEARTKQLKELIDTGNR